MAWWDHEELKSPENRSDRYKAAFPEEYEQKEAPMAVADAKKDIYTVITTAGRARTYEDRSYYEVLDLVYQEQSSAGSNWDRPNMLLLNGEIVLTQGITDVAWKWSQRRLVLNREAQEKLRAEFRPEWLKSE